MDQNRIDSFIALLDDPDDSIFEHVLAEISSYDITNLKELEFHYETSLDKLVQKRLEIIINRIKRKNTFEKLRILSEQKKHILIEGFYLISELQNPDTDRKASINILDRIRKQISSEIKGKITPLDKINILNYFFFDYYKFKLDSEFPGSLNNLNVNKILKSRKGNETTLTMLYVVISQLLDFKVHFIICDKNPLIAYFIDDENQKNGKQHILFYINVLNKGAIIGPKEIEYILHVSTEKEKDEITKACPEQLVLKNLISDTILRLNWLGKTDMIRNLTEAEKLFE